MSLATSGGGFGGAGAAGGGGLILAHDANAVGRAAAGMHPPPDAHADAGHGPLPPPSGGVLGADLLDKQQGLSLKQVKNVSHLPLVAMDLFASEPIVAYFPPKPEDPSETVFPRLVGKMKANLYFHGKADNKNNTSRAETAHKALRKYLSQAKPYRSMQSECLTKSDDPDAVVLEKPHRWLGLRRLDDASDVLQKQVQATTTTTTATDSSTSQKKKQYVIQEEDFVGVGIRIVNSTLDGSSPSSPGEEDDFDRVVFKVRLNPAKKAVTMLPEEAVQLLIHQAQYHVATKLQIVKVNDNKKDNDEDEIVDYPCAIAIPAWASHDAAIEALYDATGNVPGVFFQRSVCALAGALVPSPSGKPNTLLERVEHVRAALLKEYRKQLVTQPDLVHHDELLLILVGRTDDGMEATAIQISDFQTSLMTCLFTKFKVLSNVSYQSPDPLSKFVPCLSELEQAVQHIDPDADGPAAIVTYGSPAEQEQLKKQWEENKSSATQEWQTVPLFTTKADAVCMGTAVLGAVAHGRQALLVEKDGGKTKAELGITVQNVAPAAVGFRLHYHGGTDPKRWTSVKTIFDFDRRIPAGPYSIEFKASECVVHRNVNSTSAPLSDEDLLKAAKEKEGAKYIPQREEAALDLRLEILQKWTRDGEWKRVGDLKQPLVKHDDDDEDKRVACESVTLEISLAVTGMLTLNTIGDRQSVVQATKSARNSALQYYIGVTLAVLFFGGFLARSYWEEYTFNRDTKKLLAYYKHAIPGSISDGDENNARFLVWKFRHKKKKLWSGLEKKYGIPVREVHEWEGYVSDDNNGKKSSAPLDHDEVDLDDDEEEGAPKPTNSGRNEPKNGRNTEKSVDDENLSSQGQQASSAESSGTPNGNRPDDDDATSESSSTDSSGGAANDEL